MPALGFVAIVRLSIRIAAILWRKQEIRGLFWVTLITLLAGTWFYYQFEPTITNWVDAYYFSVITLTTIGYGDFSPTTPLTRLFTTFYVFVGLGIIASFIGLVSTTVIAEANQRRVDRDASKQDTEEKQDI